jgi:hypothetical protein
MQDTLKKLSKNVAKDIKKKDWIGDAKRSVETNVQDAFYVMLLLFVLIFTIPWIFIGCGWLLT